MTKALKGALSQFSLSLRSSGHGDGGGQRSHCSTAAPAVVEPLSSQVGDPNGPSMFFTPTAAAAKVSD